jgi:hypothetical protein
MMRSTISEPETFESALLSLFREWSFEPKMMELIGRREKDVIKNDFAKLGLFESRESKNICRKLNRFFTTNTFSENLSTLKTDQITKFVIENSLMDLLPENFIDFRYIKLLLENLDVIYMKEELILVDKLQGLLTPDANLQDFVKMVLATTTYITEKDSTFNQDSSELKLVKEIEASAENFENIKEINFFTKNLWKKLESQETPPTIKEILENFHSVQLDFIREDFKDGPEVSFNDSGMSSSYADVVRLNYSNYVQQYQACFGSYLLIRDILKNFMSISRSQILLGCEEIARLAVENSGNRELVSHVVAFQEICSVDSRNLRCFLRLMQLKLSENEKKTFETKLDEVVKVDDDLRNVESFEVFLKIKKVKDINRLYLKPFVEKSDWLRLVLLAQYLSYDLKTFVNICEQKVKEKSLSDNLIRAVLFDSSAEGKRNCSFTKKRMARAARNEVSCLNI